MLGFSSSFLVIFCCQIRLTRHRIVQLQWLTATECDIRSQFSNKFGNYSQRKSRRKSVLLQIHLQSTVTNWTKPNFGNTNMKRKREKTKTHRIASDTKGHLRTACRLPLLPAFLIVCDEQELFVSLHALPQVVPGIKSRLLVDFFPASAYTTSRPQSN